MRPISSYVSRSLLSRQPALVCTLLDCKAVIRLAQIAGQHKMSYTILQIQCLNLLLPPLSGRYVQALDLLPASNNTPLRDRLIHRVDKVVPTVIYSTQSPISVRPSASTLFTQLSVDYSGLFAGFTTGLSWRSTSFGPF